MRAAVSREECCRDTCCPHSEAVALKEAVDGNVSFLGKAEKLSQVSASHLHLQTAAGWLGERAQELAAHYHLSVGPALQACSCCHL